MVHPSWPLGFVGEAWGNQRIDFARFAEPQCCFESACAFVWMVPLYRLFLDSDWNLVEKVWEGKVWAVCPMALVQRA